MLLLQVFHCYDPHVQTYSSEQMDNYLLFVNRVATLIDVIIQVLGFLFSIW